MRNIILLLGLICQMQMHSQAPFRFELSTVNWASIANNPNAVAYERGTWVKPGIMYNYLGTEIDSFKIGRVELDMSLSEFEDLSLLALKPLSNLQSNPSSKTVYLIEGEVGSRIITVENTDISVESFPNEFFSLQFKLYEATSNLEVVFGPSNFSFGHPMNNQETQLLSYFTQANIANASPNLRWVFNPHGNPNSPLINTSTVEDSVKFLNGFPAQGTIYRFAYSPSAMPERFFSSASDYQVSNSESNDFWIIRSLTNESAEYRIYNSSGQLVKSGSLVGLRSEISTEDLSKGVYILQISAPAGHPSFRLVK